MYLQSAFRMNPSEPIEPQTIVEIAGVVPENVIEKLFTAWVQKEYFAIQKAVAGVTREGYSGSQVISQLYDRVLADVELTSAQKAHLAERFGQADRGLIDGGDEQLQLLKLLAAPSA
ncbi:replication factor C subunit 4 [Entophlyctis sp. JEL0112]|nr:replication factor C subunit 4 [Entophlyctis sp. JEL0112]